MMRSDAAPESPAGSRGHHPESTRVRRVAFVVIGLIVGVAFSAAMLWLVFPSARRPFAPPRALTPTTRRALAETQHWARPPLYLLAAEREMDAHLRGFGWSDRAAGRARVPIERAMQLLAASGRQVPEPPATGAAGTFGAASGPVTGGAAKPAGGKGARR